MADNAVASRWANGEPAIAAWMSTHSLLIAQAMAASGADAVIVDMQHGSMTIDDALGLIASIELRGAEPIVRVPAIDGGLIGRLLDLGATGIIAPLVESASQAQELVDAMRYPPLGRRSYGPRVPAIRFGPNYAKTAGDEVIALAMIETKAGIAALHEIASVDGLTGVFIGPSDLAMSLGFPPPNIIMPDAVADAIQAIRATVHANGKRAGIFSGSIDAGTAAIEGGFDLVSVPPDLALVDSATRADVRSMRRALRHQVTKTGIS